MYCFHQKRNAFTLAELLIALAILGVIATFTIPKILDSGSGNKHNAIVKETIGSIAQAYQLYKMENGINSNTTTRDLTPYFNYVRVISDNTPVDQLPTFTSINCSNALPCLQLHNGAILHTRSAFNFGSTDTTGAIRFVIDPDGVYSGSTSGPSKATGVWLFINGRIKTYGSLDPNTCFSGNCTYTAQPQFDPEYFSWSN